MKRFAVTAMILLVFLPTVEAAVTYEGYIRTYVNKRNPETRMYWMQVDVAAVSGTPVETLNRWLWHAQDYNYQIVRTTGRSATLEQLAENPPSASALANARNLTAAVPEFGFAVIADLLAPPPPTPAPIPVPPLTGRDRLIEGTMDGLSTGFADMQLILSSDLPAESKVKLVSELMNKRAEMTDKIIARKKDQRRDITTLLHNVGIFISGIIAAKVGF